jgi:hypothetical protein
MKDTGEAAAVGVVTAGAGRVVQPLLTKMGAGTVAKFLGTVGAEGRDDGHGAIGLGRADAADGGLCRCGGNDRGVPHGGQAERSRYRAIRTRLAGHYVETGELPKDAAERAVNDPVFRAQMLGKPDPHVPAGSSRTSSWPSTSILALGRACLRTPTSFPRVTAIRPCLAVDVQGRRRVDHRHRGRDQIRHQRQGSPRPRHRHLSKDDAAEIYHRNTGGQSTPTLFLPTCDWRRSTAR